MVKRTLHVIFLSMLVFMSSITIMANVKGASNIDRRLNDVKNVSELDLGEISVAPTNDMGPGDKLPESNSSVCSNCTDEESIPLPESNSSVCSNCTDEESIPLPESNSTPSAQFDLVALEAYLRDAPSNGGNIVDTPTVGQEVYFHFRWRCDGSGTTPTFRRELKIDGSRYCYRDATITPGTYWTACTSPWTATAGSHTLTCVLDTLGQVSESNEGNNQASKSWNTPSENNEPVLSNGDVEPNSGWPNTVFRFEVTYQDEDGDSPGDREHVYVYDSKWGWQRFDMNHISGNPSSGMLFRKDLPGPSGGWTVQTHNYFFHFNDVHDAEAFYPPDGTYLTFEVEECPGEPRIRVEPPSLSFEYPAGTSSTNIPVINVETFKGNITINVQFAGLVLESNDNYTRVTSSGCEQDLELGKPVLPAKSFFLLLPPNTVLKSLTTINLDRVELPGKYQIEYFNSPELVPNSKGFLAQQSNTDVSSSTLYPEETCYVTGIHGFRGYKLLSLTVFAASYYPKSHKLIQNNEITVLVEVCEEITTKTGIESLFRGLPRDEALVEDMVVNPDATRFYPIKTTREAATTYKYVIITSSDLSSAFQPLCDWKQEKLGSATIVTVSSIVSTYSGIDTQEKIRNFVKDAHVNWQTDWILLGGDVEVVPYRGTYGYIVVTSGPIEDRNIPCDLYYSDLDGTWDENDNGIYGEVADNVNLYPDVYVGRAPVNVAAEATNFVNKVLTYERNPPSGYLTKAALIAYWLDDSTNEAALKDYIANNYLTDYSITKFYETSLGSGVEKSAVINAINSGQGLVNQASHGSSSSVPPFYKSDVDNLNNELKYFIFYSMACLTNKFEDSDAISEHFILNTHGGAVAYVGNSRVGIYYGGSPGNGPSDKYDKEFFKQLSQGYKRIGETVARSKIAFISESGSDGYFRWIQYCLNLLGDPDMTIHTEEFGKKLNVYNDGDAPLELSDIKKRYASGEPTGWLSASPTDFTVPIGNVPQEVTVTVNLAGLAPNTYHAWLQFCSNDPRYPCPDNPYEVPVTLTVKEKPYTITFYTNPVADPPSITFDGATYTHGQSGSYGSGDYSATANPPSADYAFHHWDYSGSPGSGVYVPNININPTTVQVRGNGWLKAIFSAKITFHTSPAGVGSITYDGSTFTDGDFVWEVNLPPDYGNIRTIHANPPSGYTFVIWGTTGKIYVSDALSISTTLTVDGPGILTANFELDTTPPVVQITYPSEGQYIDSIPIIWINGTVIEKNWVGNYPLINDTQFERIFWDGTQFAFWNISVIPDCTHSYMVNFTDLAGNTGNDMVTFTIDTVYPVVNITFPTDDYYFSSVAVIWINGSFTEKNFNTTKLLDINHTGFGLADWTWNSKTYEGTFAFWNTSVIPYGTYSVEVWTTDLAGKTGSDTVTFSLGMHNIAVINIEVSKTVVGQNYSTSINVTIENQGSYTETFNVTAYYDTNPINTTEVTVTTGSSTIITFTWNTTSVDFANYTISAYATPVPGETQTTDNTLVDGWVVVTIPGDIDGNNKVDHKDLLLLASAYGCKRGDACYIPEADINCDGKIGHEDLLLLAANYGKET